MAQVTSLLVYQWMLLLVAIILIIPLSMVQCGLDKHKIVLTDHGPIRGRLEMTIIDNKPFYAFRGIPYGKAPVGPLRFKPPVFPDHWTEVKDTFEYDNECIQKSFILKNVVGSEDCLFLNVFIPAAPISTKPAVMVFIHGGAYYFGSGNGFGPDLLVNNGVILVTINYRLGPYGFLSLGTPEYSGNMGLKDQLAAIKWVNRNIEYFGGDSNRVTIFGESAGSASVHFQTLSPKSHGLFKRAIMESGTAISPWAFQKKTHHLEELYRLGRRFGNDLRTPDDALKFINIVDPELLIKESVKDLYYPGVARHECDTLWAPIVEIPDAEEPFLIEKPLNTLKKKDEKNIDLLIGLNTAEMYFATLPEVINPDLLKPFDKAFELQLPWIDWEYDFNSTGYKELAKEIRNFYIPRGRPLDRDTYYHFNQILSDAWFLYGIDKTANYQAKRSKGNTFYYVFELESELNLFKTMFGHARLNLTGTSHLDELIYLFYFSFENNYFHDLYNSLTDDSVELKGIRLMTSLWSNFAKYGTPTPECDPIDYPPVKGSKLNYVRITNDGLLKGQNPMKEKIQFWDNLLGKFDYIFTKAREPMKDEL